MKYEYDYTVDGLFVWFVEDIDKDKIEFENEIRPSEFNDEIGLLFNKDGKLMGIEFLPASKYFSSIFLAKLENPN